MELPDDFATIDNERLDREWLRQSELAFAAGEAEADARFAYTESQNRLELTEAELYRDVRNQPHVYGLSDKPTEASVRAAIVSDGRYQRHVTEVNRLKHELDVAAKAGNALEHKKRALENLVELDGRGYHSEPRARSDNGRELATRGDMGRAARAAGKAQERRRG